MHCLSLVLPPRKLPRQVSPHSLSPVLAKLVVTIVVDATHVPRRAVNRMPHQALATKGIVPNSLRNL
jgi:hypothetical protein